MPVQKTICQFKIPTAKYKAWNPGSHHNILISHDKLHRLLGQNGTLEKSELEALYLKEGKETTKLAKFELKLKPYIDPDPEC